LDELFVTATLELGKSARYRLERGEMVIDGYVSVEQAASDYGVVVDPVTFEVDADGGRA
jgi:hypothetical protein